MTLAQSFLSLVVGGLFVAGVAIVWIEPARERQADRRRAAARREALLWARQRELARAAVTPQHVEQARSALDVAFDLATAQYHAALETGQGGRMPTREQVAAQMAAVTGEHDRVPVTTDELLAFAALAAGFERAFRPRIAVEPADPDDAKYW